LQKYLSSSSFFINSASVSLSPSVSLKSGGKKKHDTQPVIAFQKFHLSQRFENKTGIAFEKTHSSGGKIVWFLTNIFENIFEN